MLINGVYRDCRFFRLESANEYPGNYSLNYCKDKHKYVITCEGCKYNVEGNRIAAEMESDPNDYRVWLARQGLTPK